MIWPPQRTPLEGEIVRVEPDDESHRDGLRAASLAPETWTWIDRRVPESDKAFAEWFEARLTAADEAS